MPREPDQAIVDVCRAIAIASMQRHVTIDLDTDLETIDTTAAAEVMADEVLGIIWPEVERLGSALSEIALRCLQVPPGTPCYELARRVSLVAANALSPDEDYEQ